MLCCPDGLSESVELAADHLQYQEEVGPHRSLSPVGNRCRGFSQPDISLMTEAIPIRHFRFHKHHHPEHLVPKERDHEALARNGVGPLSKDAKRFVNKIDQMFEQRRLFNGHLFIPAEYPSDWHLFYFDQRDVDRHRNHWELGEHIHLMNMVTHPRLPVLELVKKLESEDRPRLGGGLHIRYQR